MKRVATEEHKPIVVIPMIVSLAIVVVEPRITVVPIDIEQVRVAVRIRFCREYHLCHRPSNTLRAVSYSVSLIPQYSLPSIFIFS